MRALRTIIVLLLVSLGFLGGYFAGWYLHGENTVRLGPSAQTSAKEAGELQQRIIEELQGRYYKPVNVNSLSTAGVNGMLKSLDDPYTVYLTPKDYAAIKEKISGAFYGIGATLQQVKAGVVITGVLDGSPAKAQGLGPGDVIVTVDGKTTKDVPLETSVSRIKGDEGTTVVLGVKPRGKKSVEQVKVARGRIEFPETHRRLIRYKGVKVGYIYLSQFGGYAARDVHEDLDKLAARGAQRFILDLRYNPGGVLGQAVDVTGLFETGLVTSTQGLHSPKEELTATGPVATTKPLVVLVNGYSASASEIVTGALKDHDRATIIGTTTFGKGLVQGFEDLGNGAALKLTIAVYLTPDGTDINKKGIAPDIMVKDLPKTKKDDVLQRALQYISVQSR